MSLQKQRIERKIKQALVKNKVTKSVGIVQFTTRDDTKTFLLEILRKKTDEKIKDLDILETLKIISVFNMFST